jgi:hypothetical protein
MTLISTRPPAVLTKAGPLAVAPCATRLPAAQASTVTVLGDRIQYRLPNQQSRTRRALERLFYRHLFYRHKPRQEHHDAG